MRFNLVASFIGNKHGAQNIAEINKQRMIFETIGVIIHILPVEQERGILGVSYEVVPRLFIGTSISSDHYRTHSFVRRDLQRSLPFFGSKASREQETQHPTKD